MSVAKQYFSSIRVCFPIRNRAATHPRPLVNTLTELGILRLRDAKLTPGRWGLKTHPEDVVTL